MVEFHRQTINDTYKGNYDDVLYLFAFFYHKIHKMHGNMNTDERSSILAKSQVHWNCDNKYHIFAVFNFLRGPIAVLNLGHLLIYFFLYMESSYCHTAERQNFVGEQSFRRSVVQRKEIPYFYCFLIFYKVQLQF